MAKYLDNVVVIDLEATCWQGDPPANQESEIIEIGVALLNLQTLQVAAKESVLIKPERSQVSRFCMVLTSLTQEILDESGVSFAAACRKLEKDYRSRDRTWASWGDYDRRMVERQCQARGVRNPFGVTHLNVKNLFAAARGLSHEVGMDEALRVAGMELEGRHHRGVDDAHNIAKLLAHMLGRTRGDVSVRASTELQGQPDSPSGGPSSY